MGAPELLPTSRPRSAPRPGLWPSLRQGLRKVLSVVALCGSCELLVWALWAALAQRRLQFFASIAGMGLVFAVMLAAAALWPHPVDVFYHRHIKSSVAFLNRHLGVGFVVPVVMVDTSSSLDGRRVGRYIAGFVITNVFLWPLIYVLSYGILFVAVRFRPRSFRLLTRIHPERAWAWANLRRHRRDLYSKFRLSLSPRPTPTLSPHSAPNSGPLSASQSVPHSVPNSPSSRILVDPLEAGQGPLSLQIPRSLSFRTPTTLTALTTPTTGSIDQPNDDGADDRNGKNCVGRTTKARIFTLLGQHYPLFLSLLGFVVLGLPVAIRAHDDRLMDGCALWFSWMVATRASQAVTSRTTAAAARRPYLVGTLVALLNPVLWAILFMLSYVQLKVRAGSTTPKDTLRIFSSNTPLPALASLHASGGRLQLAAGQADWFGAGDCAIALLECGIVAWGFRLYECRRELCSRAGAATVVAAVCAAVISVFCSLLLVHSIVGLRGSDALVFCARSTTLALARPAVAALGGDMMATAAIVVSNGVVSQILCPLFPRLLCLPPLPGHHPGADTVVPTNDQRQQEQDAEQAHPQREQQDEVGEHGTWREAVSRTPLSEAAGIAAGVNGAAMGVAYLYERGSRIAPFAAVAMTVFGVSTVIFTSVEPFTSILRHLAGK